MKTANRNKFIRQVLWQGPSIVAISIVLSLSVNHFRHVEMPLVGSRSTKAVSNVPETGGAWEDTTISITEAEALFFTKGAVFIDARPEEVYRSGHIKGALNLPPDNIGESLPHIMAQVPLDSLVIAYCDGEDCPLGKEAALQLMNKGYSHVQVLVNGWSVWEEAGMPTEISE